MDGRESPASRKLPVELSKPRMFLRVSSREPSLLNPECAVLTENLLVPLKNLSPQTPHHKLPIESE